MTEPTKILLANPRGFCAGVERAIEIVERVLNTFPAPIYVRHEVVHNKFVVEDLKKKGAIFVESLDEVPNHATTIFSAHGVSKSVRETATKKSLRLFDATCPLVTKVHIEVARHEQEGHEVILIGHAGHPEVEGTLGQYLSINKGGIYLVESPEDVPSLTIKNPDNLAFVTQTTLSMDDTGRVIEALKKAFPNIIGPRKDDICYATQNRQDAIKALSSQCDIILVVGSRNSSNSNRLKEIAEKSGVKAYLIDNADEIELDWLIDKKSIGVSAGASVPEILVKAVINRLQENGAGPVQEISGKKEDITFSLPKSLQA